MNRGDAQAIALNITVDGEPIDEHYADELEITFNPELHGHSVRKTLSSGEIFWNQDEGKYFTTLSQEDTFTLCAGVNTWQLRLMRDSFVISTVIGKLVLGDANSKRVLTG